MEDRDVNACKDFKHWLATVSVYEIFFDCFASRAGRRLLRIYIQGQLWDIQRKNCEAIALQFGTPPRTLQRLLESIKWDEEKVRDRCQQIIARDHAHREAIGLIDESGTHKSGNHTSCVARQYNGNRGKLENCVVGVHLGYSAPGFQCLLDSKMYMPQSWANDPERRNKNYIPEDVEFQTKPQIALWQVKHALTNGIEVCAWTFAELYGRDTGFLDGLDELGEAFVGEIPSNFYGWLQKPKVIQEAPAKTKKSGRPLKVPRVRKADISRRVDNLVTYSPVFRDKNWQCYRIKDTDRGPEVWEVKWTPLWRKTKDKLPAKEHTLIVTRNVRTGEIKYFLSNLVVGRAGVTLRSLLRVAFGRWAIEACFRTAKEELGMDHFEVRGWRCIHRHWYVTQMSFLFASRLRLKWDDLEETDPLKKLTIEQVRSPVNTYLENWDLPPPQRTERFQTELKRQSYHQKRNAQAAKSHTKTRRQLYDELGIDIERIKSCIPPDETS